MVERRTGWDEVRDVRDVDPRAQTAVILTDGDRVVEVLRGLRVDRERRQAAQVDAALERRLGRAVRLEVRAGAAVDKQPFEDGLDVLRSPQRPFDTRTPAAGERDDEIPRADVTEPFPVQDERDACDEVRLADDELAALRNLDDDSVGR